MRLLARLRTWPASGSSVLTCTAWWIGVSFLTYGLAVVLGYVAVSVPPLSLLPSTGSAFTIDDHLQTTVLLPLVFWPVELLVVAFASNRRHFRLWATGSALLVLSAPSAFVPVLAIMSSDFARAASLTFALFGCACPRYTCTRSGK